MSCEGKYIKWIFNIFGDCISTVREKIGFGFGLSSTFIWMWAQIPQIYMNFKYKSAEGISLGFLCLLVIGDFSNFLGIVLTHGLATQYFTSAWFLLSDFFVSVQYVYYTFIRPRCLRKKNNLANFQIDEKDNFLLPAIPLLVAASQSISNPIQKAPSDPYEPPLLYGTILGWVSAICYISSRMPQIIKNFKRKRTYGLSPYFFITAFLGNTTYGISIFLKNSSWDYIWLQFPWLVGSLGILFFDFTVLVQFFIYDAKTTIEHKSIYSDPKIKSIEIN